MGWLRESLTCPLQCGKLPNTWLDGVARLFDLVEATGVWSQELLDAYVVLIPKASDGACPRDQRPITVLPLPYRLRSKGLVL